MKQVFCSRCGFATKAGTTKRRAPTFCPNCGCVGVWTVVPPRQPTEQERFAVFESQALGEL